MTDIEYLLYFSFAECEVNLGMDCFWALVPGVISLPGPALIRANRDPKLPTRKPQTRACAVRFIDELNCDEAI
ncbi:MAG: hypothetical protein ACYDHP_10045 [Ferrimicrobium sp.]